MHDSHEYSIMGHSRSNLGRHLGTVATVAATLGLLIAAPLFAFVQNLNVLRGSGQFIFWPLTAGFFFLVVHGLFNSWLWKSALGRRFFGIPNVSGRYHCDGQTIENGKIVREWTAVVDIFQTWEKFRVHLKTSQSGSKSEIASISNDSDGCAVLLYSFSNEPKTGEAELTPHMGFCKMRFERDGHAEGEYHNVKGRGTEGRMIWRRED